MNVFNVSIVILVKFHSLRCSLTKEGGKGGRKDQLIDTTSQ